MIQIAEGVDNYGIFYHVPADSLGGETFRDIEHAKRYAKYLREGGSHEKYMILAFHDCPPILPDGMNQIEWALQKLGY